MIKASIIIANNIPNWSFPKKVLGKDEELIVVDNGIDDEGNPTKARNNGARKARGKYLVFLDNDVRVKKGFLNKVVKYLDLHPKVGAGQLKLLRWGSKKYDSAGDLLTSNGFLVERAREAEDKGQFDKADLIFSGKGAAMVVRRSVFEKIGGFDESYIYYWEEPDLFWRVWRAGFEVRFLWMGMAEHAYGTRLKPIPKIPAEKTVFLSCRNQIKTIIKNAEDKRYKRMLGSVGLSWLGLEILFLLKGKLRQVWAIEKAWFWLVKNWPKRDKIEAQPWMEKILIKQDWGWYLGKAKAYISGRPF